MKMVRYKQSELPPLSTEDAAEIEALAMRPDREIDCSDIPELDDGFMERSVRWKDVLSSGLYKPVKLAINTKIDADVVGWLKSKGPGYQTRMNAILREVMVNSR